MNADAAPAQRHYWCFISYRHADNKEPGRQWATWLHQAIETYEVPKDLVGRVNERGDTIPERIFPVFRDEEELPVDADLASPIYRALDASKFLVVICSPRAVASTYVGSEIRYFKQLGRGDRVLAVMVEGEPNASWDRDKQTQGFKVEDECFPESMRHQVAPDGSLLSEQTEPIAADFRLGTGQGWTSPEAYRLALHREGLSPKAIEAQVEDYRKKSELMKLKVIAGILGVSLGTLTKRDTAYQLVLAQQRTRTLRRWLAAVGLLTILALGGGVLAAFQWHAAVLEKNEATRSQAEAQKQQVRAEAGEKAAQTARDQAVAAQKDADDQRKVAETEKTDAVQQRARAEEGEKQAKLEEGKAVAAKKDADDLIHYMQYDLAGLLGKLGQLKMMEGINDKIREYHDKHPEETGDDSSMRERAVALDQQGDLNYAGGDLGQALASYQEGLDIRRSLAAKDPANALWQHDLFNSIVHVGDLQSETNQAPDALKSYREGLGVVQNLNARVPGNDNWQFDLSVGEEKLGLALQSQGQLPEALSVFQDCLAIRRSLARKYPNDGSRQNNLGLALINMGSLQGTQGNLKDALGSFQEGVAIYESLTKLDPDNMDWRYQLSNAYNNVGLVHEDQLQAPPALQAYQQSADIRRFLAQKDPNNARWQSALAVALEQEGHMQAAQGRTTDGLAAYHEALAINQAFVQKLPNDAACQNNLARNYESIGNLLHVQKESTEALDNYRHALAIDQSLAKQNPDNVTWQDNLCGSLLNIGAILEELSLAHKQNHWDEILQSYRQVFTFRQHLAQIYPDNAVRQGDLAWCYLGIASIELEMPLGDTKEAGELLSQGLKFLDKQSAKSGSPSDREKALREAFEHLRNNHGA